MRWLVKLCRSLCIAGSSRKTYAVAQKGYMAASEAFGFEPLLATEDQLCQAVAYFAMGHTVSSVDSYVSAIANMFNNSAAGDLPRGPGYYQFVKGLKRLLGPADQVVRTRALLMTELELILAWLDQANAEQVSFGAEMLLAFLLALRTEDHTDGRLRWGDVYPQSDGSVEFLLPPGKSVRRFRRVAVAAKSDLLSVSLWLGLLRKALPEASRGYNAPVFVCCRPSRDGSYKYLPRSRSKFVEMLKHAVREVLGRDPHLYSGYSLRRGGVTEMLSCGVPVAIIKRHVGWAPGSNAHSTYYDHAGRLQMRIPTVAMGSQRAL